VALQQGVPGALQQEDGMNTPIAVGSAAITTLIATTSSSSGKRRPVDLLRSYRAPTAFHSGH